MVYEGSPSTTFHVQELEAALAPKSAQNEISPYDTDKVSEGR